MADNETQQTVTAETPTPATEPIRSPMDLQIEKLTARLDALENENRELRSANQGLWAQLHPVTETPAITPTVAEQPIDKDMQVLTETLGLKE